MELLDEKQRAGMEECKRRARAAGLQFHDNTLEYGVSNQDMLELMPKIGIPTLYDYWVQDVELIRSKWSYSIFPHNPYEMVVNTRPPMSYYIYDNTDWFNVMIFYHVLGHIDYFQNSLYFRNTWDDDFAGQALADKRLIDRTRSEMGGEKRWVDYVIEFSLGIDNLVGYHWELQEIGKKEAPKAFSVSSEKIGYYFGPFLRTRYEAKDERVTLEFYYNEVERYNTCSVSSDPQRREEVFFGDHSFRSKFPEFNGVFQKWKKEEKEESKPIDIFQHIMGHSDFLKKKENKWMPDMMQVIRRTSLYFQGQIRTHGCNEGWASLWHQRLFTSDQRMGTHEVDYARVDSGVTMDLRIGFNVYAMFKHLYTFVEEMARKGKFSPEYALVKDMEARKEYNQPKGDAYAKEVLFAARTYLDDYLFVNLLSKEDFQDFVDSCKYFTVGARQSRLRWDLAEYYIKSKNGEEFRRLLNSVLYHPPYIAIREDRAKDGELYLDHIYEGRSLYPRYIPHVLVGIEYLWGKPVKLETTEFQEIPPKDWREWFRSGFQRKYKKVRVLYTCEKRKTTRTVLDEKKEMPPGLFVF